ncbi:MAG: hypothetical protein IT310_12815 [Anaerolineales bacterium]|nr:hypothetical protein [Anaerolineales bacterium]
MNFIFSSPSTAEVVTLLRAWRFWALGALLGALLGAAVYIIAPPPYRARATVNVDFNLEAAWPKDVDRQQFYYLEREARKLEELAWSDEVLAPVSAASQVTVEDLRATVLQLSQPAEAGWHFYAEADTPQAAEELAAVWANTFVQKVQAEIDSGNINPFVKLEATQTQALPKQRSVPLSNYLLAGALGCLTLAALMRLFVKPATAQP